MRSAVAQGGINLRITERLSIGVQASICNGLTALVRKFIQQHVLELPAEFFFA